MEGYNIQRLYGGDLLPDSEIDPVNDWIPIRDASVVGDTKHKKITVEDLKTTITTGLSAVVAAQGIIISANQSGIAVISGQVLTLEQQVAALSHTPMDILTLTNSVGIVEVGSTVSSITFNWTVNKTPTTLSFDQGIGSITPSLTTLTTAVNITSNTTYTLTANDGTSYSGNIDTASTSISFQHKIYWGTSASTTLNSTGILALASSAFGTTRIKSFTIDGNGQYLYYSYPASMGDASFNVNGLLSTAWTKTVISFTNASGNTTSFNVYRSDTIQNGTGILISVS